MKNERLRRTITTYPWDVLIVLDACRFDFFEKVFRDYFVGCTLKKAISSTTNTVAWLNKTFPAQHTNIIYVSANPYVNSKTKVTSRGLHFEAKRHFAKVIDVWDEAWDKTAFSVYPKSVNAAFLKARSTNKNKRFILHYIQPHCPYIGKTYAPYLQQSTEYSVHVTNKNTLLTLTRKVRNFFAQIVSRCLGIEALWTIGRTLNISSTSQLMLIGQNEGLNGVRAAYMENLRLVLSSVRALVAALPKSCRILITADHGEYLGEYGLLGHASSLRRWPIYTVPWLFVNEN